MKNLMISVVAVTFLGPFGTALAVAPKEEALPLGIQTQLELRYSLARSDQNNVLPVQHRYDDRRHGSHRTYRHDKPRLSKYSHGKNKQKNYGHKKYGHGKHWNAKYHQRGNNKRSHEYRHGHSHHHQYNKYHNAPSIRLRFGPDGLIHYQSR